MSLISRYPGKRAGWGTTSCPERKLSGACARIGSAAESVLALLLEELRLTRSEEMVHLVRLADEEEVILPRRLGGRADRCESRIRDRRGGSPRRRLELYGLSLSSPTASAARCRGRFGLANRRVDAERHPVSEPVVDHGGHEGALLGRDVSFSIIDAMVNTSYGVRFFTRIAEIDAPPLPPEERELVTHEPLRSGEPRELVCRRKKDSPLERVRDQSLRNSAGGRTLALARRFPTRSTSA